MAIRKYLGTAGLAALISKTKAFVRQTVAGAFRFRGSKASLEELDSVENPVSGDVWQVGQKEYAWNGTEWVELGFTVDLSPYKVWTEAKKYIDDAVAAVRTWATGAFAALSHKHAVADVDGLQGTLDGKAASGHTHTAADVTGLQSALDGKFSKPSGTASQYVRGDGSLADFPAVPSVDDKLDIDGSNGTQAGVDALLNKLQAGTDAIKDDTDIITEHINGGNTFTRRPASKIWEWIKGKADAIYAAKSHTHPLSQVSDLHADWDAKLKATPASFVTRWPAWGEVTGKPTTFTPASHTHTASQVTGLTASRALISDSEGKVAVSPVTSTELGYLDGATSNIQAQLNAKAAAGSYLKTNVTTTQTVAGYVNFLAGAGSASDIRFKANIRRLANVLETLGDFNLIEYDWSVPGQEHHTIGFDAAEFLKAYPSLVHEDDAGRLSLEYQKIGAIALQACKELNRELLALKREMEVLKGNIN